jgi:hypothetical protein
VALTLRSGNLAHHGGQVSLPGGAVDAGETVEEAALREAREEIGVDPAGVAIIGSLTPLHIPVSGFTVNPVIGISRSRPTLEPSDGEVARIIEAPISQLLDPSVLRCRPMEGMEGQVPYFDVHGQTVWGATAMVLAEFLWLLGCRLPDAGDPLI